MSGAGKPEKSAGTALLVWLPYVWLALFIAIPCLIVFRISLSQTAIAQPPYVPLFDVSGGFQALKAFFAALSFENYSLLSEDALYISSYLKSISVASFSTLALLILGYPIAYAMALAPSRLQAVLVMLVILPFWTSFLIRVYAWITILQRDGLLNRILQALGIVDEPVAWLASDTAIYIGILYSYLPFMVLPLYATLQKMDDTLLEAAADLGCRRWQAFWKITVPLSIPGVVAGALLCFIPITGEFVIPDLLGGSQTQMIGQTLWTEFFSNKDWPVASAIAIVLLCVLLVPIALFEHMRAREVGRH